MEGQMDRQEEGYVQIIGESQTDRDRQIDRQSDRQTDRLTDGEIIS